MVLDTKREEKLDIGKKFSNPGLKEGECAIHEDIASRFRLNKGDDLFLSVSMETYLNVFYTLHDLVAKEELEEPHVNTEYEFSCKIPSDDEDSYIYMELKHFLKSISIRGIVRPALSFLRDENPYQVVIEANINHPNRMNVYKTSNYDKIKRELMIRFFKNK